MQTDDLKQRMQEGATLLVSTQRAAKVWRRRLTSEAADAVSPVVLPWNAWTAALWQALLLEGRDDRIVLNPEQNAELWARTLHAAQPGTLRPVRSLVRLCVSTQHLVHLHGATDRLLAFNGEAQTDTALFADWFRSYTRTCDLERLLPASMLDDALGRHFEQRTPTEIPQLYLLGFDDLLPSQHYLLDRFAAAGSSIELLDAATLAGVACRGARVLRCVDAQHEWSALSNKVVETGVPRLDYDADVLIVMPEVERSRAALDRTLRAAFGNRAVPSWEFAAGQSLATLPLPAAALRLLRWTTEPLPVEDVGDLLQSPFLHFGIDADEAGELDADVLRDSRRLRPEWTLAALAHRLTSHAPVVHHRLLRIDATAAQQLRGICLPGIWIARLEHVLNAAGWPGIREQTSIEFQIVDRWNDLLETVASLDLFNTPIPFATFLEHLQIAAAETLFGPENVGAPIQVVSPAEAAGTTASLLWFAHATEDQWNARRNPSPLLPWPLQAECGMPGTSAVRDGEAHLRTTRRLLASADDVIISYAATDSNGDHHPSAVFDLLSVEHSSAPPLHVNETSLQLEPFFDNVPLPPLPTGSVHGGVGVLKDQAACAFRAFAERRLFSSEPETTALGLNQRQRGELLHYVLQLFWDEVETQDELLRRRGDSTLASTLHAHIDTALTVPASADAWNSAYLGLQRRRLFALLMQWLDMEAQRPLFRVLATEQEVDDVHIGPLQFNLRVDRIDEVLRDGEPMLALLDYKTGSPVAGEWLGPRPAEPQLPLYAVAASLENVGAIAFATVTPGSKHLGLRALPATTELLFTNISDKQPEVFEAQMEQWYATLERLATEFADGDTHVSPREYPQTCQFCGQRMLCRLNPELLPQIADEEEALLDGND